MPAPKTRVIAGITVPDTPLITTCVQFTKEHSSDFAFNHVWRSLLLGFLISSKIPSLRNRDVEVHAIAAIMHDLGWDPTGVLVTPNKRFEVDGANAARNFIRKHGNPAEWPEQRLQLVWDAIALHTIGSIAFEKEAEVQACAYGIWADFQGPDRVVQPDGIPDKLLTWEEYRVIVTEFPRLGMMAGVKDAVCHLCQTKPETTYDNTVGEWGDMFVEGYSREGKLTRDMLLGCELDGLYP